MSRNTEIYLCLTADIINSRSREFKELLDKLPVKLAQFNKQTESSVPLSISAGDEVQGLFKRNQKPFSTAFRLFAELYPLQLRVGLGIGNIDTSIKNSTAQMRGSAFENARNALEEAKKSGFYFSILSGYNSDLSINSFFIMLTKLIQKWNNKTFHRFLLYLDNGSIHNTAKLEGVSPEAINKFLHNNAVREVIQSITCLDEQFES